MSSGGDYTRRKSLTPVVRIAACGAWHDSKNCQLADFRTRLARVCGLALLSHRATLQRTMLRLSPRRRTVLVETFRELANLAAAALVLGWFVSREPWSLWLFLGGIAAWLVLVGLAVALADENSNG